MFALHTIRSRFSPARLARAAYLLLLAAIVLLLLAPSSTRGQFRGLPAVHSFPGIPFTGIFPNFSGSLTSPFSGNFNAGLSTMHFSTPGIPSIPQLVSLPGAPMQFPLNNFMSDSTGGLLALTSGLGFGGFSFPAFGMLGFGGFGFPGFGGFGVAGYPGYGGLGGFNGITGLGGMGGIGGAGGFGGMGGIGLNGPVGFGGGVNGFAGKGIGGFNGRKPL